MEVTAKAFVLLLCVLAATSLPRRGDDNQIDEEDEDEIEDLSYLIISEELNDHKIEILNGDKKNSHWLLVDDHYICHLKTKSETEEGRVTCPNLGIRALT